MSVLEFMTKDKNTYPISSVAANEWKSFAMYTVESRAIPNMIDGLKPVQRFYLYSSLLNSKRDFKKVSAVSGIISDYGYNHGETSAASSGQLMAATWNNNICLVEGRGSFGTRLVQEAGAARYVYTRMHKNFDKYIKDLDLSPKHEDPEHEPPAFYLPVIPLVLTNGAKGIATGFATNILPRDPKALERACKEYIEEGTIKRKIPVKFPDFKGKVTCDPDGKFHVYGKYEKKSKTILLITEVPYGFDREGYVKVLDGLEDSGDIVSYEDVCDKNGFAFEVKLKQNISANWNENKILSKFKLVKPMSENLTVIGPDGKLRLYNDAREIVKAFCDYRLTVLKQRIDSETSNINEELRWLKVKMEFIIAVLDSKIVFKNRNKVSVMKQTLDNTSALDSDMDKLLGINILSLTKEMVIKLKENIQEAKDNLSYWKKTSPKEQFIEDLSNM